MDGDTNIHRLRVISFGKNGTGKDYFVEQVGDNSRHLMPSKKITKENTSSRPEIHASTDREQRDSFHSVKTDKKTICNVNEDRVSHLQVPISTARDQGDTFFQVKTNHIANNAKENSISRPEAPASTTRNQYNNSHDGLSQRTNNIPALSRHHQHPNRVKDETGPNDVTKRLIKEERLDQNIISNKEQRHTLKFCKQTGPKREKEEFTLLKHRGPSPKTARNNSRLRPVQMNERKLDPQPAERPEITKVARKSTSGIFRIPVKRKVRKYAHNRIFNVDDAKRSISYHSFRCSDRIKQIFKRGNKSKLNIKKNHQKELNILAKSNDNVKVLFSRETAKITDAKDNKSDSKFYSSKDDIFGFRKSNRFRSTISVYQQYRCQLQRPQQNHNIKLFKPRKSYSTEHIPLRVMTSRRTRSAKSADSSRQFNTHVHRVNVVEFPQDTSGFWNDRSHRKKNKSFQNIGVDPLGVLYSSPNYSCNDAGCGTHLIAVQSVGLNPEKEINETIGSCGDPLCVPLEDTIEARNKEDSQVFTILKYILFGLVILVWSPCIVMVVICWLITYPLRPSCITARARARSGLYQERLPCGVCPAPERGFWSSFIKWIKSAEWYNRGAYQALASLIKKESKEKDVECEHQLLPNPNKRYTLYHSADRGWIMKPIRFPTEEKNKEILNVLCDPLCPHKREPKKPKPLKKEKKKVRINAPADNNDYGTVKNEVEYRQYKKNTLSKHKAISSQPQAQLPPQPYPQQYGQQPSPYPQPHPKPPPVPCPGYCMVPTCKKHKKSKKEKPIKVKKPKAKSLLLDSPSSSLEVDDNTKHRAAPYRYLTSNEQSVPQPRKRAFDAKRKGKKGTAGQPRPCLPCVSRTAPCARPPCEPCRLRILKQLKIGQARYAKEKHDDPKSKSKTKKQKALKKQKYAKIDPTHPQYDTKHIGHIKYQKLGKVEKKKFRRKQEGNFCLRYYRNLRKDIDDLEKAVWFPQFKCSHLWVQTLKKKPCFWIYEKCPSLYPSFLDCRKNLGSCCHFILFCLSTFIWFPPIFCCYLCMQAYCRFFS